MAHFDLTPLYRSTVGFDHIASLLDSFSNLSNEQSGFPPYNITLEGENVYRISIALAGFSEKDLDIEVKENTLTIKGEQVAEKDDNSTQTLHRGIAARNFVRRFQLADHVEVKDAKLVNGLLHIDLVREIPEAMKPRKIEIGAANNDKLIEGQAS